MTEWAEIDLDRALWTIPSLKMKRTVREKEQGEAHIVPLPTQAVALLRGIQPLTGHGRYVFPGERSHDRPLSDNSVLSASYPLGFGKEQSWHGFRASARTMLAALFHTFNGSIEPIDIEAMESAARVTAWHLTEARRFLGELAMLPELANPARLEGWLLDYCKRENTDQVPTRAIQQFGPGGLH